MKPNQSVCLDEILHILENGPCRSETRSLCQTFEKICVRSRGHIFSLRIMKLGQNVCLEKVSNKFENNLCQVKN